MSVLILFATVEGQTGKIARFVETIVQAAGHDAAIIDASDEMADVSFEGVDKVILAASVHERRHPEAFEVLLAANRDVLASKKTLMLSVSLAAAFPEMREEAEAYLEEMKMRTKLDPDQEMLIGGAVRPSSYGYFETQVLSHVVLRDQNVDPRAEEREFTDWEATKAGVQSFLGAS